MADAPINPLNDPARATLARLMAAAGTDCKSLSLLLGRNAAYVHQFLYRGTPRRLGERERALLADYFGVDEAELGAPPGRPGAGMSASRSTMRAVPQLAVGASAGGGAHADDERIEMPFAFDERWLRRLSAQPAQLAIIRVEGDSMLPTLAHGDDIMVDAADGAARLRDGIYVLRRDDMLLVKRLARAAAPATLTIISDNPAYPREEGVGIDTVDIVGRVVWAGRRIS